MARDEIENGGGRGWFDDGKAASRSFGVGATKGKARTPEIQDQRVPEPRMRKRKTRRSVVGMEQQRKKVGGSSRKSEPTEPTDPLPLQVGAGSCPQSTVLASLHTVHTRARTCPWSALVAGLLGCWAAGPRLGVLP